MTMTISDLMQRNTVTVDMDDTAEKVEALFARHGLSWAPVRDKDGPVVGVVSRSDLDRLRGQGRDGATVPAWQVCSYHPIAAEPGEDVAEVARRMVERHVHHVVVMQGERLLGVVSALDFVRLYAQAGSPAAG